MGPSDPHCSSLVTDILETLETMDSSSIELPGTEIASISVQHGRLRVRFSRAFIVKTMTGSEERTRWWQAGDLIMEGVDRAEPFPSGPLVCDGGDIDDNVYTYRDMIPLPLDSRGRTACRLRFRGTDECLLVTAESVRLEMTDVPKYIEHIRPSGG
jgi:hypothetical protein